jgi:Transglutaminase-like superfamily
MDLATLRAALWTMRALLQARRRLRRGLGGCSVSPPPRLPRAAGRGVHGVLRRWPATCLERALVLQRWEAAHGSARPVVIGVRGPAADGFQAHAWLDGEPDPVAADYHELTRLEPDFR